MLIPLFLEIVKSNLGKELNNLNDYLIYGGLCLIVAIFSDKFIDSIGDKILETVKQAEKKAQQSNEKTDILIKKKAEPEVDNYMEKKIETLKNSAEEKIFNNTEKVIESLKSSQYEFRTLDGIIKYTGLPKSIVIHNLRVLSEAGMVKMINSGKRSLWTLNN